VDECKALITGLSITLCKIDQLRLARLDGRGLHSLPFQLNLTFLVHRITQLNP
jgi:hypothetical protein